MPVERAQIETAASELLALAERELADCDQDTIAAAFLAAYIATAERMMPRADVALSLREIAASIEAQGRQ